MRENGITTAKAIALPIEVWEAVVNQEAVIVECESIESDAKEAYKEAKESREKAVQKLRRLIADESGHGCRLGSDG